MPAASTSASMAPDQAMAASMPLPAAQNGSAATPRQLPQAPPTPATHKGTAFRPLVPPSLFANKSQQVRHVCAWSGSMPGAKMLLFLNAAGLSGACNGVTNRNRRIALDRGMWASRM